MSISVTLGNPPFLQFTDNNGKWLADGKLYTRDWNTREDKVVWTDATAIVPYANPIILDGYGRTQPLFFETDAPYYLYLTDKDDVLIWDSPEPYYPNGNTSSPGTEAAQINNLFINSQFRFFPTTYYSPVPASIPVLANGGWSFSKDGTNNGDRLEFHLYNPDDNDAIPPSVYALRYAAPIAGLGESKKDIEFLIKDVRSLNDQTVTLSFNAAANVPGIFNIGIGYTQHFGTGGSVSSDNHQIPVSVAVTGAAQVYSVTFKVDNLENKSIGTNGDDYIKFIIRLPLNVICDIQFTNMYLKLGDPVDVYPYKTYAETLADIVTSVIPSYNQETLFPDDTSPLFDDYAYDVPMLIPNAGILTPQMYPSVPPGSMLDWPTETPPSGWLLCEGQVLQTYGLYNRLYKAFGSNTDWWGKPNDNLSATIASNVIQVKNDQAGVVLETPTAGTTPFTITVVTPGNVGINQIFEVTCTDGSIIAPGQYWFFSLQTNTTTSGLYYIWYRIDKEGNQPNVPGKIGIRVDINRADTAAQVAAKTFAVLNPLLFYNVDLRGFFVRYWNHGSGGDPDAATRSSFKPNQLPSAPGDFVGTFQNFEVQGHTHQVTSTEPGFLSTRTTTYLNYGTVGEEPITSVSISGLLTAASNGGSETRPKNVYLAKIIKY